MPCRRVKATLLPGTQPSCATSTPDHGNRSTHRRGRRSGHQRCKASMGAAMAGAWRAGFIFFLLLDSWVASLPRIGDPGPAVHHCNGDLTDSSPDIFGASDCHPSFGQRLAGCQAWEFEMTETVTLLVHNRTPDAGVLERKNQSAAQKRQALASGKC